MSTYRSNQYRMNSAGFNRRAATRGHWLGATDPYEVENAEEAYLAYAAQAEAAPHRWGDEQQAHLEALRVALADLYEQHDTPADDRIAGVTPC